MRIKSIKFVGKEDVYNLEVANTHSFAVENGTIVHNCADEIRYFSMARPIANRIILPKDIRGFDPLATDTFKVKSSTLGIYL